LKKWHKIALLSAGIIIVAVLAAPMPVFDVPHSTVVEAAGGELIGARIADDGQWRFPEADSVPYKFEKALLAYEDRYFHYHPGINPVSIIRAFILNVRSGTIVSGGSTISMQVARLAGNRKDRGYKEKLIEILSALKLELLRSKRKILLMYAANAPFGGNTVGLDAAAWRYLSKPSWEMTWAEAASMAVLPNSPGLVYPGKNQERLKKKRDDLLRVLNRRGYFDSLTLSLSLEEPLPGLPSPLPSLAPHLTDFFYLNRRGDQIRSTIDAEIQLKALEIINKRQKELSQNLINNLACLVVRVSTGEVLAYVGNSQTGQAEQFGGDVDIILARRSSGSILKPFLYAAMQHTGDLLPEAMVADIPSRFEGFSPQNFNPGYSGAVPASKALAQSLNIPAVRMLQEFTPALFLETLKKCGFTTFDRQASHYGLSLILGGGETTLWELTGAYASLSRILNNYNRQGKYFSDDVHPPVLVKPESQNSEHSETGDPVLSASSIWLTCEALRKVNRPEEEAGWQYFSSPRDLAWKTGTSYGFRDAWAVGTTPEYVAAVWAGNAGGEGRPGLTGIQAAAPVLFDLVNMMGTGEWFEAPYSDMTTIKVCTESGYRAGRDCPETIDALVSLNGVRFSTCPWHRIIHTDSTEHFQVSATCYPASAIRNIPWFVLPPAMEYYYRLKNPQYKTLPSYASGCRPDEHIPSMEFIYPSPGARIFIPRDQTGSLTRVIPEIIHRKPGKKIFWHLDDKYLLTTTHFHQAEIYAGPGDHVLTAVDEDGNTVSCRFEVIARADME